MKRSTISAPQNVFFNAQNVDDENLSLEQNYNSTISSGIISNHIGSGVLPEVLTNNVLFDSSLSSGFLDGAVVTSQKQPSDNNFGNQIEIELTDSKAAGNKSIKVAIIGLDFQNNLQYETFYFRGNESQVGRKHFTQILLILFNDFIGNPDLSLNLGGKIIIKEVKPVSMSRDPLMVSQDVEPNLFFRDFFLDGFLSLQSLLKTALPLYNIDTLNILTSAREDQFLLNGDVTTQIGQKFIATTNNIQKVTLLLSVRNLDVGHEEDFVWNGDLIVSIYPLQSNVSCSTDIAPNLPIDFSPSNIPLAQISINYSSLQASGVVLDSVSQPIDFIFSNSPIAAGNILTVGNYYVVTIKRSGSANKCDILIAVGGDHTASSRLTTFTGSLWVDLPEEDLWFKIWTDSAKISDGQCYDSGYGIVIPKTNLDPDSQTTVDYSLNNLQFVGNNVFQAVVSATTKLSDAIPDERTGNPVLSVKQFVPDVKLLNSIDISNLEKASDPLIIGAIADKNRKFFDSISSQINSKIYSATFVGDELLIKIVDDPTDAKRFDTSVSTLTTNLLNGDLVGAKIITDANNSSIYYRIASAKLCSMILGDVDGDGVITQADLDILNTYLNFNMNIGLPLNSFTTDGYEDSLDGYPDGYLDGYAFDGTKDGYTATYINGYLTYTNPFINAFGVDFQLLNTVTGLVVASGNDGVLVANPSDSRLAQFTSSSVTFSSFTGLSDYKLLLSTPLNQSNYGGFDIVSLDTSLDVLTIRKVFLTGDVIAQLLRCDIDGDFVISSNDGYLLSNYIARQVSSTSATTTFPSPSTNPYTKIGTKFNVIRFKLEKFIDRADDYSTVTVGRSTSIHSPQDIFIDDGYFASHNFYNFPSIMTIVKQLTWDESLIVTNTRPKLVPSVFASVTGFNQNDCGIDGVTCNVYNSKPDFDSGRTDFFVPDNLIIGDGGELKRPDGNFYKVDFEVGTIVLEIPDGIFGSDRTINILDDFISDYTGSGITRLGFPAMRFADCSLVKSDSLSNDQVRFSVSVQSFSPNINGVSSDGYEGAIVDGKMGVSIDYSTGLLTLNFTNLFQDVLLKTLSTKIQINVFLKKGGFNNQPIFIDSTKVSNMLKLISVFSGAVDGGPSALVDLRNDVTSILPVLHGGTGLSDLGASGTVLTSNGSSVSYAFVVSSNVTYTPSTPGNWSGTAPTNVKSAIDRMAALLFSHYGAIP